MDWLLFFKTAGYIVGGFVALAIVCNHFYMLHRLAPVWVPEHNTLMRLTWVNENQFLRRMDGGTTAFAKCTIYVWPFYWTFGEEAHGMLEWDEQRGMPRLVSIATR